MTERQRIRSSLRYPAFFSAALILVKLLEVIFVIDLSDYGILPRTVSGLKGVLFAGFIHGDIYHLFSNLAPVALMSWAIIYFFGQKSKAIIIALYFATGAVVWVFARPAYHIGASGLVYAMLTFLLISGLLRRDRSSLAISLTILVLYGGSMVSGILPANPELSWESHLAGFCLGIVWAILYRKIVIHSVDSDLERIEGGETSRDDDAESYTLDHTGDDVQIKYVYKSKKHGH